MHNIMIVLYYNNNTPIHVIGTYKINFCGLRTSGGAGCAGGGGGGC